MIFLEKTPRLPLATRPIRPIGRDTRWNRWPR